MAFRFYALLRLLLSHNISRWLILYMRFGTEKILFGVSAKMVFKVLFGETKPQTVIHGRRGIV